MSKARKVVDKLLKADDIDFKDYALSNAEITIERAAAKHGLHHITDDSWAAYFPIRRLPAGDSYVDQVLVQAFLHAGKEWFIVQCTPCRIADGQALCPVQWSPNATVPVDGRSVDDALTTMFKAIAAIDGKLGSARNFTDALYEWLKQVSAKHARRKR